MVRTSVHTIVVFAAVALLYAGSATGGPCTDPEGLCTDPCPAENSCLRHEDCLEGQVCAQACLPSWCACYVQYQEWACSDDCAGECVEWFGPAGPLSYMIIDLGTLGGWTANAHGINNLGQIVGEADLPNGVRHAFLWENGVMTDLYPDSDTGWSTAPDINNFGEVLVNYGQSAFLWDNGEMISLGGLDPAGRYATGYAINDARQIVGSPAFLWEDGAMMDLYATVGLLSPQDINSLGHVAGAVPIPRGGHAGVWDGVTLTDLGTLGGDVSDSAAINDLGQVVGQSERAPGGDRVFYPFLWEDGVMTDLGALATLRYSRARGMNNAGQVVGETEELGVRLGFLYDSGHGMRDLRDLLPLDSGWWYWYRLRPNDINDAGQIVGYAIFSGLPRAFLMTPIDADFDDDNDTDLVDFAAFRSCMTGPGAGVEERCRGYDINRDARIDLVDLRAFQWKFTGP